MVWKDTSNQLRSSSHQGCEVEWQWLDQQPWLPSERKLSSRGSEWRTVGSRTIQLAADSIIRWVQVGSCWFHHSIVLLVQIHFTIVFWVYGGIMDVVLASFRKDSFIIRSMSTVCQFEVDCFEIGNEKVAQINKWNKILKKKRGKNDQR